MEESSLCRNETWIAHHVDKETSTENDEENRNLKSVLAIYG